MCKDDRTEESDDLLVARITNSLTGETIHLEAMDLASLPFRFEIDIGDKMSIEWVAMSVQAFEALPENKEGIATCIGCGCTDRRACQGAGGPCWWLVVDYDEGVGVCSECETPLERWLKGDRTLAGPGGVASSAEPVEAMPDKPGTCES